MVWISIIKALGIASFKGIYPKILTSSKVRGICLINKSYFSVIIKTTVARCLEVSKKVYDLHPLGFSDFYPYIQIFNLYLNSSLV